MGQTFVLFPSSDVDCASVGSESGDARVDYACTSSSAVLSGLTTLHLLILLTIFTLFTILFLIYSRISSRGLHNRLYALPGRRIVAPRETHGQSLRMYRRTVAGLASIAADDVVPQPSRANALDGAILYGTRTDLHKFVVSIGADLLSFSRDALAAARRRDRKSVV